MANINITQVQLDNVVTAINNRAKTTDVSSGLATKVDKVTSTDNAIARFDGTTGALQNSGVTISDANVVTASGFVGPLTGNASTATKLVTARAIALTGGVTGSVNFDGSANVSITATVADDSHNHIIDNVDGLQTALDSKAHLESPTFTGTPKIGTNNITSISTTVTDNAIARYDGTTGKLQGSGVIINDIWGIDTYGAQFNTYSYNGDTNSFEFVQRTAGKGFLFYVDGASKYGMKLDEVGNLLLLSGTGAIGYGAGAGGTVTQLTSKSTAVTLNKPTGKITTASDALAAGASVLFIVNNSTITSQSVAIIDWDTSNYRIDSYAFVSGSFVIRITNITGSSRSEALDLMYTIIRGATA